MGFSALKTLGGPSQINSNVIVSNEQIGSYCELFAPVSKLDNSVLPFIM